MVAVFGGFYWCSQLSTSIFVTMSESTGHLWSMFHISCFTQITSKIGNYSRIYLPNAYGRRTWDHLYNFNRIIPLCVVYVVLGFAFSQVSTHCKVAFCRGGVFEVGWIFRFKHHLKQKKAEIIGMVFRSGGDNFHSVARAISWHCLTRVVT